MTNRQYIIRQRIKKTAFFTVLAVVCISALTVLTAMIWSVCARLNWLYFSDDFARSVAYAKEHHSFVAHHESETISVTPDNTMYFARFVLNGKKSMDRRELTGKTIKFDFGDGSEITVFETAGDGAYIEYRCVEDDYKTYLGTGCRFSHIETVTSMRALHKGNTVIKTGGAP